MLGLEVLLPESDLESFDWLGDERARTPISLKRIGSCFYLLFCEGILNCVEIGNFHPEVGVVGRLAIDQLKIANRRQKRRTFAARIFPALAGFKAQGRKKL